MAMDDESRSFRTKTGRCRITDDKLILSREGAQGELARGVVGSSIGTIQTIYIAGAAVFAFAGVRSILDGHLWNVLFGGLACLLSLCLVLGVMLRRGLSAAPEILRASIQRVDVHRPRLIRGYFVVHFVEDGKPRKQLIVLPLFGGASEFEKAVHVLEMAGLTKTGVS